MRCSATLRDRELSWSLREPYDAAEFRFVVAAALATDDKLDPRSGLRVPISMPVVVTIDGDRRDGFVRNVSIGGAYVALEAPPEAGASIRLALDIGDRPLDVEASVAYCQTTGAAGRAVRESGMGVAFRGLEEAERAAIAAFIGERIRSFQLCEAAQSAGSARADVASRVSRAAPDTPPRSAGPVPRAPPGSHRDRS